MQCFSPLDKLKQRACIHDASHYLELDSLLGKTSVIFYCGFDPTADSLHAGSMLPLILMRRLQDAGHQPIVLLGSATGMIGDPSGKSEERKLLDEETLQKNLEGIEQQIKLFLSDSGENKFRIVKNSDWLNGVRYIEFLRDIGKHFSVNAMVAKDSVKARLERAEQGISYTEFSYMLLQAYDFYWLNKSLGCRLQVGGSDQWGNITAGLELIRRKSSEDSPSCYGLTFPLLTTASGAKFGKTEKGAIWLDAKRTSSYNFYQYWINTADADVIKYIKLFTPAEGEELKNLESSVIQEAQSRTAQMYLAQILTRMIHGERETTSAINASKILFGESFENIDSKTLLEVFSDVPSTEISKGCVLESISLADLLVQSSMVSSKGAARRAIEGGGVYINNVRCAEPNAIISINHFVEEKVMVLRSGKKNYHIIKLGE